MTIKTPKSRLRRLFTWRHVLIAIPTLLLLVMIGAYGFLWYISNFRNLPELRPVDRTVYLNVKQNACRLDGTPVKEIPAGDDDSQDSEFPMVELTTPSYQGWCDVDRQNYYRLPQGTNFFGIQYDWLGHLELPVGKKPLVTREFMQRLGFVYDPAKEVKTNNPLVNTNNPLDLPMGITWHYDPACKDTGAKYCDKIADFSCAACHSGQMTYQGTVIQIDGSPGNHALPALNISQFLPNVFASITTTLITPFKFSRFAKKVLADVDEADFATQKKALRKKMWATIGNGGTWFKGNFGMYPTEEAYGRTDGLGRIANTVYADDLSSKNYRVADAPVNYPHMWDIWAFDWVQWMGSVKQPMARNLNESLGVRSDLDLHSPEGKGRYETSALLPEMHCIETTLQHLKPPTWSEDLFGSIDRPLADEGKQIFEQTCKTCHGPFPSDPDIPIADQPIAKRKKCTTCHGPSVTDPIDAKADVDSEHDLELTYERNYTEYPDPVPNDYFELQTKRHWVWQVIHIPLEYIGTDPQSALNMINYRYDISSLKPIKSELPRDITWDPEKEAWTDWSPNIDDWTQVDFATGLRYIAGQVRFSEYRKMGIIKGPDVVNRPAFEDLNGFGEEDNPKAWRAYRPRPLEGVWATAPYLHNGSIPSIYQLLLPADERDQTFYLGRKEFNPLTLGLQVEKYKGAFKFDTSKTGNSNLGHEFDDGLCGSGVIGFQIPERPGFCRQFTERERMAVLEYLKVHDDGPRPDPRTQPHCSNSEWPERT